MLLKEKRMTTSNIKTRSALMTGAAATLALAAFGFAGAAQARDNVAFSVGVGLPGVQVGVTNAYPVYQRQPVFVQQQPVYVQPQPVYVQPQPVYVQPRAVYYGQPVYVAPQPVYYGRPHDYGRHHGYYQQQRQWNNGYSQTYYQREGRHHGRD
jgi:PXPV repeat (3 copies)